MLRLLEKLERGSDLLRKAELCDGWCPQLAFRSQAKQALDKLSGYPLQFWEEVKFKLLESFY